MIVACEGCAGQVAAILVYCEFLGIYFRFNNATGVVYRVEDNN